MCLPFTAPWAATCELRATAAAGAAELCSVLLLPLMAAGLSADERVAGDARVCDERVDALLYSTTYVRNHTHCQITPGGQFILPITGQTSQSGFSSSIRNPNCGTVRSCACAVVGLFGAADLATVAPAARTADFGAPPFVHGARIRTEGARGPACSYHRRWPRIAHGKAPTEDGSLSVFETAVAAAKPLPEEKKRKERAPKPEKPPPQPVRLY